MYLSDRDIISAIEHGKLIVEPKPDLNSSALSSTSLDLRLDSIDKAKVWDIQKYADFSKAAGLPEKEIGLGGTFDYNEFSSKFLSPVPKDNKDNKKDVFRKGDAVVVKKGGFLLWQTKEIVGTSPDSKLICFVDGKSKLARTGLLVHLTAPTIHTTWRGNITLEITNVGPFDFILKEDDYVVQITVAAVSSIPNKDYSKSQSQTYGQTGVGGANKKKAKKK